MTLLGSKVMNLNETRQHGWFHFWTTVNCWKFLIESKSASPFSLLLFDYTESISFSFSHFSPATSWKPLFQATSAYSFPRLSLHVFLWHVFRPFTSLQISFLLVKSRLKIWGPLFGNTEHHRGVCVICSVMSDFATPWTLACQTPLSMEFSRQEYWAGLPLLSPGDLTDPGIEPRSPALQAESLLSEPPEKLLCK